MPKSEIIVEIEEDHVSFLESSGVNVANSINQFITGLVGQAIKQRHEKRYQAMAALAQTNPVKAQELENQIDTFIEDANAGLPKPEPVRLRRVQNPTK